MNCEILGCRAYGKVQCFTCKKVLCFECLKEHVSQPPESHLLQSVPNVAPLIDPLEILLRKIPCSSSLFTAIRRNGTTLSDLLKMTLTRFLSFCQKISLIETSKILLWDEICYINLINGRTVQQNIITKDILALQEGSDDELEIVYPVHDL